MVIKALGVGLVLAAASSSFAGAPVERAQYVADCTDKDYCSVAIDFTADQAAQHLGDKNLAYWIEGDTIRIAARADGDELHLCCTFQGAMTSLGADSKGKLWARAYRLSGMDRAIISMIIPGSTIKSVTYRGPDAPPAPEMADTLQGKVTEVTVTSTNLKSDRKLVIYTPAAAPPPTGYPVIYMADGKSVNYYAHLVEKLIDDGKIRPVLLVGIAHGEGPALKEGGLDQRNREYLPSPKAMDEYLAHEAFVLNEVMPLAEKTYHASTRPQDRMAQGVSSGASWALSFAVKHHDLFGQAAAFSVALEPGRVDFNGAQSLTLYLEAGHYEDQFFTRTEANCKAANAAGVHCGMMEMYAGHDSAAWDYALAETLKQAFKPQ